MAYIFQTDVSLPRYAPHLEPLNGAKHSAQFYEALRSLEPIDAETIPKSFQLKSEHRILPDVFQGPAITFVSDPVKELIKTLEPDVHQFIEVELLDRQGNPTRKPYHRFHIRQWLDSIVVERSTITWEKNRRTGISRWVRSEPPSREHFTISAEAIKGHHIWAERKMYHNTFFCSKQFFDKFSASGYQRLHFQNLNLT